MIYLKLLFNEFLCLLLFFILLLIPTFIEYHNFASLDLSIYSYIALLISSVVVTIMNLKIIRKKGLFVGLIGSFALITIVCISVIFTCECSLSQIIAWPLLCSVLFSSIFGAIYINYV